MVCLHPLVVFGKKVTFEMMGHVLHRRAGPDGHPEERKGS